MRPFFIAFPPSANFSSNDRLDDSCDRHKGSWPQVSSQVILIVGRNFDTIVSVETQGNSPWVCAIAPSCYDLPVQVAQYRRGIQLFNERSFFDAHETWEDVWRETNGSEKKFLQGLIQVAVAFHHHSTGNVVGACSLFERARKNLVAYPETFHGISVKALTESVAAWRHSLIAGTTLPAFPQIVEGD